MAEKLSSEDVKKELEDLDDWELLSDDKIKKVFLFDSFKNAFSFMIVCAAYAEEINHHPEWQNIYKKVTVVLTTHDADGLSELDFKMASFMDKAFKV